MKQFGAGKLSYSLPRPPQPPTHRSWYCVIHFPHNAFLEYKFQFWGTQDRYTEKFAFEIIRNAQQEDFNVIKAY